MSCRLRLLRLLPCLVAALGCSGDEDALRVRFERPDIILISIDSLRPDHLGCYGYGRDTSPTIDRIAAQGIRFTNAVSTTSWTLPAHAALFTGLYDSSHGLSADGLRLGDEHVTLAEVLRDAGYQTAGFFGGPYLHPSYGLGQGFEIYRSCMTRIADDTSDADVRREARGGVDTAHVDVTGPRALERVESFLWELDGRPLFLFLHLWDVHYDYMPPQTYVDLFDPGYDGRLSFSNFAHNAEIHAGMSERDRTHLEALYDGEIRFTDDVLTLILEGLDRTGHLEQAVVVVTADHGEEFFEHGGKGHRRTLFDEVVRIPLILRLPEGIAGGRVLDDPVQIVDLMPTLLSLAGVPLPVPVQGRDLSPLLRGRRQPAPEALLELRRPRRTLRALRTADAKLIADDQGRFAYFDLESDPGEQRPLSPERDVVRAARRRLAEVTERAVTFRDGLGARAVVSTPPDPELRRRLEALGYLQAPDESTDGR